MTVCQTSLLSFSLLAHILLVTCVLVASTMHRIPCFIPGFGINDRFTRMTEIHLNTGNNSDENKNMDQVIIFKKGENKLEKCSITFDILIF